MLARVQSLVAAELEAITRQLPFPVLSTDSDNDSAFINETLTQYCAERGIEFTRSRPYRKNDRPGLSRRTARWSATSSVMTVTLARWPDRPCPTGMERCDGTCIASRQRHSLADAATQSAAVRGIMAKKMLTLRSMSPWRNSLQCRN